MDIKKIIGEIMYVLSSIGIPISIIGVGIIMFGGLSGKEQTIGITITLVGIIPLSLILPLIVIYLLISYKEDSAKHSNTKREDKK